MYAEAVEESVRSSLVSEQSNYNDEVKEGISLHDYVVQTCGPDAVRNFSN